MISFWISVVPPKIDWACSAGQGGFHLVSASRGVRQG